jgi:SAM-dependent methyltransferase
VAGGLTIGEAYSSTGRAWQTGPGRLYDRLAAVLVAASPVPLTGRLVADIGAGTGAASRAVSAAGGRPVAVDLAVGMLAVDHRDRPPAVAADLRRLPLRDNACGALVAAFSLNHVPDPQHALAEAARVVARGGPILVSSYAADDDHPVKAATETAARELGWSSPPWVDDLRERAAPHLASVERALAVASAAGLTAAEARAVAVPFPDVGAAELVEWRLGMAQLAPFAGGLRRADRARLRQRALHLLGEPPPLVRRMVVLHALA